jgi:glycosyltransferase involved in cell wall biosynthesis
MNLLYFFLRSLVLKIAALLVRKKKPVDLRNSTICFVVPSENKGWILDGIAKDIKKHSSLQIVLHYGVSKIPSADIVVFMHWAIVVPSLIRNISLMRHFLVLHFTHHDPNDITGDELVSILSNVDMTMAMNSNDVAYLKRLGHQSPVSFAIGAADPTMFFSDSAKRPQQILISGQFLERKNPKKLIQTIRANPDLNFFWLGPKWSDSEYAIELDWLTNVITADLPYTEYPRIYADCGVYLSLSTIEGGPIPLLETMMSNMIPVVSNTGFAPDLIDHGKNGFLIDFDASVQEVSVALRSALACQANVSNTVLKYNWNDYADTFFSEIMNAARG